MSKKLTYLDIFCGCGGLARGFMDAGFRCVLGVDSGAAAFMAVKVNRM